MTERALAPKKLPGWVWGGLVGCAIIMSWTAWNTRTASQKLQDAFGGESHVRCVRDAGRVYATRLGLSPGVLSPQRLEDFVAVAEPIEVPRDVGERFQKLLTASSSYDWGGERRKCSPRYGYRLRFVCDDNSLEALICLECRMIEFVADGKHVGGGVFEPSEAEIKRLSTELFPGDLGIEEAAR